MAGSVNAWMGFVWMRRTCTHTPMPRVFISTWLVWLRFWEGFVIHSVERQLDGWMDGWILLFFTIYLLVKMRKRTIFLFFSLLIPFPLSFISVYLLLIVLCCRRHRHPPLVVVVVVVAISSLLLLPLHPTLLYASDLYLRFYHFFLSTSSALFLLFATGLIPPGPLPTTRRRPPSRRRWTIKGRRRRGENATGI